MKKKEELDPVGFTILYIFGDLSNEFLAVRKSARLPYHFLEMKLEDFMKCFQPVFHGE